MELDKISTVGLIGDRQTAKTNLGFYLLSKYKGKRKIYLYGYPKVVINPKTKKPYETIHTLNDLEMLTDSIIFIDELQKHNGFKFYINKTNFLILDTLSTLAHNNNTILFSTQLTQFINKAFDGFIDGFVYTRLTDLGQLKNGSKAKRLLEGFSCNRIGNKTLRLANGEYIQIVNGLEDSNGLKSFPNMNIGKDWKPQ